jgi:2',3'-cyclic-nucleotide 2'-phosphodiesterase (5'-nucleotidase family)
MPPVRARRASIDLILFGHSHQELPNTMINGMLLMQPKN